MNDDTGDPTVVETAAAVESERVTRAHAVESERSDRADAVEADRSDLAGVVETDRSDRADVVESDRSDRAGAVEQDRSDRADAVELDREERAAGLAAEAIDVAAVVEQIRVAAAALLEEDRKRHNLLMEERLKSRARIINRRFWFLFLGLIMVFGLLAYRSEVNSQQIDENITATTEGLYQACLDRAATTVRYNQGREALVQITVEQRVPPLDPAAAALFAQQLRDGLLLPIEECPEPE